MLTRFRRFRGSFGAMLLSNAVSLLFLLPAAAWTLLHLPLLETCSDRAEIYAVLSQWLLGMIPLGAIADAGAAAVCPVLLRAAAGGAAKAGMLRKGLRRSLRALLPGALWGVAAWLLLTAANFYAEMRLLPLTAVCAAVGLWLLCVRILLPACVSGGGRPLRRACAAALWHMPVCLLSLLLTAVLPALLLVIPAAGPVLWGVYMLLCGTAVYHYGGVCAALCAGVTAAENGDE